MMTLRTVRRSGLGLLAAALLAVAPLISHAKVSETPEAAKGPDTTETSENLDVQQEVESQVAERRKAMMAEAQSALDETHQALAALEEGNREQALEALARATGKLELLVARDPHLALAPVDVDLITHDLYATPQAVRVARERAEDLLEDGKVQEARALLSGLASEVVIRVTNVPLATYPAAIKAVSPLIDEGKTEVAKTALNVALNTLVVTRQVVSLPVLRARAALDEAESMLGREVESHSEEDMERVRGLVATAREQVELAELLGYGGPPEYRKYRKELAELESKIRDDKDAKSVFSRLRSSLEGLQTSFFE